MINEEKRFLQESRCHSHKKRKSSLEGSLDQVLFATEIEFPKILVLRLPQHTSIQLLLQTGC